MSHQGTFSSPVFGLLLGLVAALALSACTTLDPYTGEERTARATTGTVIGAISGAVLGAATASDRRDRKKRMLIGAGVGALSGGAVGAYMDRQEDALREQLEGTDVSVTRDGDHIHLNMPGDITFGFDSADVRADFYEVLDSVSIVLEEFDQTIVEVSGHTDSTGAASYNQRLSERRAQSVSRYLLSQGVTEERMLVVGYGEDQPVASNDSEEGRQQNRRVELTLVPLTED
ncbi:outer membrane protein OmpA-like peptidoglycan-associated protein [Natronospira proteinivora]|uniref:Outer membrane protein OmpA-like peptidoglycan-associated protein n=1 Tax=Natronospira proteinivora TaxID=1807133 RepID=A0ABT1G7R9_9GAMM|nr:OmpA family protein [Natronospira proteinivora]MCP1727354.1 outer membrane protein OmpA-like peptidoglycan-associated protein [Natronospira proteinivora]